MTLNKNSVASHHFLFVPLGELSLLTGAYLLNSRGFHPPGVFAVLSSVNKFVPIYAVAPWYNEGVLTERTT